MKPALAAAAAFALVSCSISARPQTPQAAPAPQHQANFDAERAQANQLYLSGKALDALPLYEDLCRQDPSVAVFAERHASGLLAKMGAASDAAQKQALMAEGIKELQRAESLGDNSPYVETILSQVAKTPMGMAVGGPMGALPLTIGYTYNGSPKAQPLLNQAESAFGHNDLPTALKFYLAAAAEDPRWYPAALYAGDAYFRLKDYANAGLWYAKAVAIDPDRDTAYRFWGDALIRSGDIAGAKIRYEQAIVAEPYSRETLAGLQQWGYVAKISIVAPAFRRPGFMGVNAKPLDPAMVKETGDGASSWLVYQQTRQAHGKNPLNQWIMAGATTAAPSFAFTPNGYVHTLAEEVDAIDAMLLDLHAKLASGAVTQEKLDPSLKTLLQIQKDDMLEPFILLNFNDAGLRHGYPGYRAGHREQIAAYIDRYDIGAPVTQPAAQPLVRVHP